VTSFDPEQFFALASARGLALGTPLVAVGVTGSTNDDALEAARAGAPHGATFVAETQNQGRGRRGSAWSSPPGQGLTFSTLLRPKLEPERMSSVTLAVGLAVRDAVALRVATVVGVKWPNDVVVAGKKLAGILVESQLVGGRVTALVVGIGLNVAMREFPPELSETATSLALLGASDLDREPLLCDLLLALDRRLRVHEAAGLSAVLDELRGHDALLGRRVRVEATTGIARGIDADGALLVEDGSGSVRPIVSGTVELL
jgi:BirA family transcriptional regulator, biotin operon repressor / biotin---[acetyl-CoA-carboxylase] ligase